MKKYLFLKKERFSIRKFSVGAASVLIGTSLFASASPASADSQGTTASKKTVAVHYLEEKELTADEKQLLENFQQSHTVQDGDEAYYFVYRPSEKTLPNTGSKEVGALAVVGTSLLVATLVLSRKSKRLAVTFFALGGAGVLTTTVLADSQLAQFFDRIQVVLGGDIPQPKAIQGYQFTGYFYRKGQSQPAPVLQPQIVQEKTDKNALPIKPLTPDTAVKPDETNQSHPITPKPDKLQPTPNPQPAQKVITAKGDQTDGGSANVEPALPEFKLPTEAKGDQTGNPVVNDQPTSKDARDEYEEYALDGKAGNPEAKVREREQVEVLPFQTITKEDPTLEKGQTKVEVVGRNGQKVTKLREFYTVSKDGRETIVHSDILSTQETRATNQVLLIGTKESTPVNPQPNPVETAKGDQTDGGSANVEPSLPEFPVDQVPVETAKGDQTEGGSANVEPALPAYPVDQVPVETAKGDQTEGGSANVEPALPEYPVDKVPVETAKGDQTDGGSANVEPALSEYPVDQVPVETAKGDQTDGGSANVEPALPEFPVKPLPEPKVVTEELPIPVRYEADDSLEAGQRQEIPGQKGQKTTTTTYTLDDQTGEIVAVVGDPVITEAKPTIIKVGTKPQQTEEQVGTRYQGDPSQDLSYLHTATGQPKVTTTTYTVNPETGEVSPETKVTDEGTATVVTKGTKPTTDSEELSPIYQGDDTKEVGTQTEIPGAPKVTTTTYTVDEATGVVTPLETVTNDGKSKIIIKGTKPTTRPEDLPVVYKGDETKDFGTQTETAGTPQVTTTTYTVNPATGEVTSDIKVTDQGTSKVITKGTKPTTVEENLPVVYKGDESKEVGTESTTAGTPKVTTTTYTVNPETGQVTSETKVTDQGTAKIITKGTKPTTTTEDLPVVYKGDESKEVGTETETTGSPQVTTTTYTVNPATGEVTSDTKVTDKGTAKVITKGTKPTTTIEALPVVYKGDETKEVGTESTTEGTPQVTTTTYTVNPETGEVTSDTKVTSEGTAKVITKGTKPKTVTADLPVIYKGDETKEVGTESTTAGSPQVTTTTYTVNPATGEVTSDTKVTDKGTAKVITKGTKPKTVTEDLPVVYKGDETKDFGTQTETAGTPQITTTTYTVNPATGEVTSDTKVTDKGTAKVITKGTKPTIDSQDLPVVYKGDESKEVGTETEMAGSPQVTTTTYTVNPATGEVTSDTKVTDQGTAKIITKGTKPQTVTQDLPVVYKGDESKEVGTESTIKGTPQVTTTTYTVNPETGEVTSDTKVTDKGTAKVITKGTKPKVEEKVVTYTTTYKADVATPYGKQVTETKGENGKEVTTTTYTLNEKTGEVTASAPTTEKTPATNAVIKVGNVDKKVTPIAITETEIEDPTLEKGKTEIRDAGQEGASTTTTTYTVNPQTGALSDPQTVTAITKEMKPKVIAKGTKEVVEKQVDFNDVTSRELYRVASDGSMERVTGLESAPSDASTYLLKLIRRDHKDVLLPVNTITEKDIGFEISYTGAQYKHAETMTLSKVKTYPGAYTQFDSLLTAIKANPSGTYTIGADLVATPLKDGEGESYISSFSGTLESADPEKNFTISNLNKPLFTTLTGRVQNVNLDVNISAVKAAALAVTANNATISNVHLKGTVAAAVQKAGDVPEVAGLVIETNGTTSLTDVSTTGNLAITKNPYAFNLEVGGIVSKLTGGSIDRAVSELNYSLNFKGGYSSIATKYVGGVVGQAGMGTRLNHVVAKGTIDTSQLDGGATTGAIVGANAGGTISNTLNMTSNVSESVGLTGVYAGPTTNTNVLDTVPNAVTSGSKVLTADQANQLISDWKVKTFADTTGASGKDTTDTDTNTNALVDYTTLDGASSNRATAYTNISKLLPFYDAATIVDYGNKVATTDKLYTTQVTAVVPLAGDTPVGLTSANAKTITQILIHYADGSVEKRAVQAVGLYKDSNVYEYQLDNGLLFTPEQLVTDRNSLAKELATEFKKISFDSTEMQEAVKLADANKGRDANAQYKMEDLFWKSSFNTVQANMDSILEQILSNDTVLGNSEQITQATKQKLLAKKAQVLVGLSYLARLYDIHFDDFSLKNILTYRPDFYGQKQDVVDWLASFGDLSFKDLQVMNNYTTFTKQFAKKTGSTDLINFLEQNKAKFAPEKTMAEWFKSTTKASVYEVKSKVKPDVDVSLYAWLTSNDHYYVYYILPLLNLRDNSVYATTNISFMGFGIKDRHLSPLERMNPTTRAQALKQLEDVTIPEYAERWATYTDMWYNVVNPSVRERLIKPRVSLYGGYFFPNEGKNSWLTAYDTQYKAMEDFFAATGNWFDDDAGTAAYARTASDIHGYHTELNFRRGDMLSNGGSSTLTHEFTHAMDFLALLDGYQRRPGQDAESFAMGLLESTRSASDYYYGFNFIQDYKGELSNHNQVNTRFKSASDLGEYMHGVFDLTYALDAVEAEAMLALPKSSQRTFLDKIDLVYDSNQKDAQDRIRAITDDEWNAMNLKTIDDLIDNSLVKRDTLVNQRRLFNHGAANNYTFVSLYSPIYGATLNDKGIGGGLQFRKTSLELLAAKGWHEGFIPYASNKLEAQAKSEGAVYSDAYVFKKIVNGEYDSYADLKKAKYHEALAKVKEGKLKSFTINLKGQSVTIDGYAKLSELLTDALKKDASSTSSREVDILKSAIIKEVHHITDDFKTSIYNS